MYDPQVSCLLAEERDLVEELEDRIERAVERLRGTAETYPQLIEETIAILEGTDGS